MANSTPDPPPPPPLPPPQPPPASPGNPLQKRNLLIGVVLGAVALLMLSCCCCGGCTLLSSRLGGGGLGPGGSDSRLVGTWKGKDTTGFGINYTIELKSNGRYEVQFEGRFVGSGSTTGKWRVKLVEDERYILDTADDSAPDETIGWTVIFEEPDQILMHQPNGDSWRLKRQ